MSEPRREANTGKRVPTKAVAIMVLGSIAIISTMILSPLTPLGNDQLCFDFDTLVIDGCISDGVRLDSYYRLVKIYEIETNNSSIRVLTYYDKVSTAVSDGSWYLDRIEKAGYTMASFETTDDKWVKKYVYILFKLVNNTTDIEDEAFRVSELGRDVVNKDRQEQTTCTMEYLMCDSDISVVYHVRLCGTNALDRHVVCLSEVEKYSGPFGGNLDLK